MSPEAAALAAIRAWNFAQKRSTSSSGPSTNWYRLAAQASWLSIIRSLAASSAAWSIVSSLASASRPIIEIEVFGSNETSWMPGPMYLTTLAIASPPPQATILSKYCGR